MGRIEVIQGDITKLAVDVIAVKTIGLFREPLPERVVLCTFDDETTRITRELVAAWIGG